MVPAADGCETAVKLLLDQNADALSKDKMGQTSLMVAAAVRQRALGELSEDRQDDPVDRSMELYMSLPRPSIDGHETVVKLVLDRNANLYFKDEWGQIPLLVAAAGGHEVVGKPLCDRNVNADFRYKEERSPLRATGDFKRWQRTFNSLVIGRSPFICIGVRKEGCSQGY